MAVYRNDETIARLQRMFLLMQIVGFAGGAIGLARAAISGPGPSLWSGLALVAIALVSLYLRRRTAELAVETDPEGLVARNMFSTRRLPWDQIETIDEGTKRRGVTMAFVRTMSGKQHALTGVGDPGRTSAKILKALGRDLRSARRR
ncbi:MAG TPA: PH domain-containing protein [Actinomycetota bacterium]|nr:PH domain-containing protein [Actinomycetota bacterium]